MEDEAHSCLTSSVSENSESKPKENFISDELEIMKAKNAQLENRIVELTQQINEQPKHVLKCGYLYKYRPWTKLFEKSWELRFFSLSENVLSFWRSESEANNHPRGIVPLTNCYIVSEGKKNTRYFVFRIDDENHGTLLRLSSGNEADACHWVRLLINAGCRFYPEDEKSDSENEKFTESSKIQFQNNFPSNQNEGLRHRFKMSTENKIETEAKKIFDEKNAGQPENISKEKFFLRPSMPAHRRPKESPLSSDAIFDQSHGGLFNLCVVVLVAVNSRLIIENLMKYGILIRTGFWISSHSLRDWPLLICGLTLLIFPFLSFLVEKLKVYDKLSDSMVIFFHVIITTSLMFYPSYAIHKVNSEPLGGFILIFNSLILWMKLISYAHTNADVRSIRYSDVKIDQPTDAPIVKYPDNISFKNMIYFLVAPTLCYQLGYPRSRRVRKGWVLRQIAKLIAFTGLVLFIVEQYINPTIQNSKHPFKGHFLYSCERVLKLSIPTLYVWLCIFYCFFHLWLNILAELIGFGDREFYRDWWNAKTIDEYWRLWNMPVHKWLVRHVYIPCLKLGASKGLAMFVVFLFSAVFHEVLIGLPCHMFRLWAFLGIMFQIPLIFLTNFLLQKFKKPMIGNIIFWFFFCIVGQPICLLLYYHDVQVNHRH